MTSRECIACLRMRRAARRAARRPRSRSSAIAAPCSVSVPSIILKPLSSGGLWLPVIITAAAGFEVMRGEVQRPASARRRCRSRSAWTRRPSVSAANRRGECTRGSRPTTTLLAGDALRRSRCRCARTVVSSRSRSATPRMSYSRKMRGFTAHRYRARPRAERASMTLRTSCACVLPDDEDRVAALDDDEVRDADGRDQRRRRR